jgi:hypothetical protein
LLQNLRFFFRTHRKQLRTAGIFFLLGLAYYIITQLTPLRIPCLFQKITGLACPGCGISHFCIRLLHLDFLGRQGKSGDCSALSSVAGGISGSGAVESKVVRQGQQSGKSSAVGQRCCASAVRRCPQSSPYGIPPAVLSAIALLFPSANIIKQYRLFLKITGILRA